MSNVTVKYPKVKLIANTPEPERVITVAAMLCYSDKTPEEILKKLEDSTPETYEKYIQRLSSYGHQSPLEHASFTFTISNMTRSCLAQITRHRIASFSVQSQRYVNFGNFTVGIPEYIEYPAHVDEDNSKVIDQNYMQKSIDDCFEQAIEDSRISYNAIHRQICFMLICKYICDHAEELFGDSEEICLSDKEPESQEPFKDVKIYKKWFANHEQAHIDEPEFVNMSSEFQLDCLIQIFLDNSDFLKEYRKIQKVANENARAVLPNACTCNAVVTMNARELLHFFSLRCCNRAQQEIRSIAWQMLMAVRPLAPNIFKHAGPSCLREGCHEGAMTCGHPYKAYNEHSFAKYKQEIFAARPEVEKAYRAESSEGSDDPA